MPKQTFFNLQKQKQDAILDAAMDEFASFPYDKATIDNIVKKAGIPKGSFYQYFSNKEDVYRYLFEIISREKTKKLELYLLKLGETSFSEFIRRFYFEGIDFNFKDSSYMNLREKFFNNCSKELRDEILEFLIQDSNRLFEVVVDYYISKGELKEGLNIRLVSEMLTNLTILFGKQLRNKPGISREHIMDTIEEMICIIETGIKRS